MSNFADDVISTIGNVQNPIWGAPSTWWTATSWLLLTAGLVAAYQIRLPLRLRTAHYLIDFGEVPLIMGLLWMQPMLVVWAVFIASCLTSLWQRRTTASAIASISRLTGAALGAQLVFTALTTSHGVLRGFEFGQRWPAAMAAGLTASTLSAVAISIGILLHSKSTISIMQKTARRPQADRSAMRAGDSAIVGSLAGASNTAIGVIGACLLSKTPQLALLIPVPATLCTLALKNRGYGATWKSEASFDSQAKPNWHGRRFDMAPGLLTHEDFLDYAGSVAGSNYAPFLGCRRAIAVMRLPGCADITETLSPEAQDFFLAEITNRLRLAAPEHSTLGLAGTEAFAVDLSGLLSESEIRLAATKIKSEMQLPFLIQGLRFQIPVLAGLASTSDPGIDSHILLRRAETATHQPQRSDGELYVYSELARLASTRKMEIGGRLRDALARGELNLGYQPVVNIADRKVIGVEALLRWKHPTLGEIDPQELMPIAEDAGLMYALTSDVLFQATKQVAKWQRDGHAICVAVNVPASSFREPDFVSTVGRCLAENGLDPTSLTLELTESTMILDPQANLRTMRELVGIGVSLALDDFGTGYSSLAYLAHLPLRTIKLDKSLVMGLTDSASSRAIVCSTIALGAQLGMGIVAEGVEDIETWNQLEKAGAQCAQGYFVAPALTPRKFSRWMMVHGRSFQLPLCDTLTP